MTNWRSKPRIIQEIRIMQKIPEIRWIILKIWAMRGVKVFLFVIPAILTLPNLMMEAIGKIFEALNEKAGPVIWGPFHKLRDKISAEVEYAHALVPVDEIRRRAFDEHSVILPKSEEDDPILRAMREDEEERRRSILASRKKFRRHENMA